MFAGWCAVLGRRYHDPGRGFALCYVGIGGVAHSWSERPEARRAYANRNPPAPGDEVSPHPSEI